MGAACCCLRGDCEDFANPNSSIYRNCVCFRCFVQNFLHAVRYDTLPVRLIHNECLKTQFNVSNVRMYCLLRPYIHYRYATSTTEGLSTLPSLGFLVELRIWHGILLVEVNEYVSVFNRGDEHALPSSTQGATSLSPMSSLDNSLAEMYRSPPRPLPYDADPRYLHLQRDGLVSRKEKGSSHSHEETEPLRPSNIDEQSESLSSKNKWNELSHEEEAKEFNSESLTKLSTDKATTGYAHIYASSDDEDVCPTCLEEYTTENPKIITKCSHHFHLGCIYEWMERSDNCPVCGKVMDFDETA